jgi:biopolymer transport protein ExbD
MLWREPKLIPPGVSSCGHLVITIADDRQLYLNSRSMGKLYEPLLLIEEIEKVFDVRTQSHVYRRGMEEAYEVPYPDRIDKTVYLKAGRALSYGDVHDLVERLKAIGANPIGLLPDPQYPFTEQ